MSTELLSSPFALTTVSLAMALALTCLWARDMGLRAARELQLLGFDPGRAYKLGAAWTLVAVRYPRNRVLAALAVAGWIGVAVSLRLAHA